MKGLGKDYSPDPWDFKREMIDRLSLSMQNYFEDWFVKKFENDSHVKFNQKSVNANSGLIASPDDTYSAIKVFFEDEGIREGLNNIQALGESDEGDIGFNEFIWLDAIGVKLTPEALEAVRIRAKNNYRKGRDFELFIKQIVPYIPKMKRFDSLDENQKTETLRFYLRVNSYVATNLPKGEGNQRFNYIVKRSNYTDKGQYSSDPIISFELKDGINIKTGKQNPYAEKMTLFETFDGNKDVFRWVSKEDYYHIKKKFSKITKKTETETDDIYGFLSETELYDLLQLLERNNLAIAFMRGEERRLALVRITKKHKDNYNKLESYVEEQFYEGYLPEKSSKYFDNPAAIAVHEAMKKAWPRYLFDTKGAANTTKRMKIPLTPITSNKNMPNYSLKIFDPFKLDDNGDRVKVSFVFKDSDGKEYESPATKHIKGVGEKYVNDGGGMAGRAFWNNLIKYGGVNSKSGSNKNVIYFTEKMKTIMVKHEMSQVERDMEIWYNKGQANEQLVAKVDSLGNITDENGNSIDYLATPDEVKVGTEGDGYAIDAVHRLPGASVGFINYRDKTYNTSTHGTQWYSYIQDEQILKSFEDNVIRSMNSKMAGFWDMSRTSEFTNWTGAKTASEKIEDFIINKLDRDDTGYSPAAVEHAKLGAGLHRGQHAILNAMLQSKGMNKIIKAGLQPGTKSKIVGNLRGDLNENEVAIAKQNASLVYKAIAKKEGISVKEARSWGLSKIETWLAKNPVEFMITRYPVPHVGGVIIARVKRLHTRHGLIEMSPEDVYAKLEGDMDGDEVQLELLTSEEHTELIKNYLSKLNITGINLGDFIPQDRDSKEFLNLNQRMEVVMALAKGGNAIAEVANLVNVYGQLSRIFDEASIDGNVIKLRRLDEKVFHPGLKKEMPLREVLRYYLQASLDNAEFMLLSEWNYHLPSLYALLFKRADGVPFQMVKRFVDGQEKMYWEGTLVYNALKPLIELHKIPGKFRRGRDIESGVYKLDKAIKVSDDYMNYMLDRRQGFEMEAEKEKYLTLVSGFVYDIKFKQNGQLEGTSDSALSPFELATIAPIMTMDQHIEKYNRRGYGETLFETSKDLHENAHLETMHILDSQKKDLINRAFLADEKNGLVNTDKLSYIRAQKNQGLIYRSLMAKEWYEALKPLEEMGPQTLDRNDRVREKAVKFDKKFKELSKTARVIATLGFLQGFRNMSEKLSGNKFNDMKKLRIFTAIPHASSSKFEIQLLDETVLKTFYREYNNIINNPSDNTFRKKEYTSFDSIITELCR